jgi:hypothetical protein
MSDFKFRRLSTKLVLRTGYYGMPPNLIPTHAHWCPACKSTHDFAVEQPFRNGARWTFDGNAEAPTFNPSMNIRVGPIPSHDGKPERTDVCHYFLHAGQIQYLGDCTHAMAGQTVDLPDIPAEALRWADEI